MKIIEFYTPVDNSYCQCIDDNGKNHCLAGDMTNPQSHRLRVIIQPFKLEVWSAFLEKPKIHNFLIGLDENTGLRHLVICNNL